MGISEKLGYVRGLADGLGVKDNTPEGRLMLAIIDLLGDMAGAMVEMGQVVQDLEENVDDLISDVYDDEDDDEEDESHIRFFPGAHDGHEDDADDEGDPRCISCGAPIAITREVLEEGRVTCPACGQQMTLDIQDGDHECGCGGCGCGHSHEHGEEEDE